MGTPLIRVRSGIWVTQRLALREMLIWSGRSLHLSSMGSGDIASKAMTATTGQSDSPSARTDQLRDGNPSPKQPLDTLADQNSDQTLDDLRSRHNFWISDPKVQI